MKQAKAKQSDIDELALFMTALEENGKRVPIGWRKVVYGCEMLILNACDPDKNYLDWKPEIIKAMPHLKNDDLDSVYEPVCENK